VAAGGAAATVAAARMYALLTWTWVRAVAQYPVSLVLLTLATALVSTLDLAAIALMFARTPHIAGFTASEVLFLYATSGVSFALADLLLGTTERLGQHVREGTLDAMLVRPVSPLIQIATEDFSPRRCGKLVPTVTALVFAVPRLEVTWTPLRAAVVPMMIISGTVIFAALWVLTAAVQFVMIDGHPATKSITYGGAFVTQYPFSLYGREFVRALTWTIPLAFVNWQPALYVFGRPDPLGLPEAFRFASPIVAVLLCGVAAVAWRAGLRHYRSTGS
jgi:viologen exporter family transport system permease protein